jgi:hypothetical protein
MSEKRKDIRIKKNFLVNISSNGFEEVGLTANLSRGGLLLVTTHMIPSHSDIGILIAVGNDIFDVHGEIRWMVLSPKDPYSNTPNRVGVKIKEAPKEYFDFIENFIQEEPK